MSVRRAAVALALGVATVLASTAALTLRAAPDDREWAVHVEAGRVWTVSMRRDPGRWWHCLDRYPVDLRNGDLDLPAVPAWARPDVGGAPGEQRIGIVALGWPRPWMSARWRTGGLGTPDTDARFVPPAEIDEDGQAMDEAMARLRSPASWHRIRLLPAGLALDVGLATAAWWLALTAHARFRGRGTAAGAATPPAAAGPRPARG